MSEVKRIAVLGGGIASLSTVLELTSDPDWASRYEITVYQMGWRLGGKGASSRNHDVADRVEEHGLHVWFGCYDHSFRLLRVCYEELDRPKGSPLATIEDAFTPCDETPYFELVDGEWTVWPMWFPPNPDRPGTGGPTPSVWDYLIMTLEAVSRAARGLLPHHRRRGDGPPRRRAGGIANGLSALGTRLAAHGPELLLKGAHHLARRMPADPADHGRVGHKGLLWVLERARSWTIARLARATAPGSLRRVVIEMDLASTIVIGCLRDGVHRSGFESIDDEDLRAWLERHGAMRSTIRSTPVRAIYDLYFAYEGGDTDRPSFSAGVAINAVLRLAMDYKGSVVQEMRAGMGEVVIQPIYEVLAQRGVRFAFFQRVEQLHLDAGRTRVERIDMARQVDLLDGSDTGYQPLTPPIDGARCWPDAPLTDQIENGDRLEGIDLESRWSGWTDVGHHTLEVGRDFDVAVLGISLAGLDDIAADFRADDHWRDLLDRVGTTQTQAAQLWMDASLDHLGWARGPVPADALPEPLDVWADRTEVMGFEQWAEPRPRSLQYLCGPMTGDTYRRPPDEREAPAEALEQVMATLTTWLDDRGVAMWPGARGPDGGFDWGLLHASAAISGRDRLGSQYVRANIDPSERYVLSLPGTARYRPSADGSGYDNLVLTGDWTRTEWNVGCIESAVLSGINAACVIDES